MVSGSIDNVHSSAMSMPVVNGSFTSQIDDQFHLCKGQGSQIFRKRIIVLVHGTPVDGVGVYRCPEF